VSGGCFAGLVVGEDSRAELSGGDAVRDLWCSAFDVGDQDASFLAFDAGVGCSEGGLLR
jgi:hypothetical protein